MKRSLYIGGIALVLFACAGCTAEKKRLETELLAAQETIVSLRSQLESSQQYNRELADSSSSCRIVLDMAFNAIDSISGRNEALRDELKAAKTRYEQSLAECTRQVGDLEAKLGFTERERDTLSARVDQLTQASGALIEHRDLMYNRSITLKDWYNYWRQEAKRSWWQRTWGTGQAKRPESSEQTFEYYYPASTFQAFAQ